MAVGSADVVEPRDRVVEILAHAVELAHLVEHAERAALLAGAIVRHHDEQRVVEQVQFASEMRRDGQSAHRCDSSIAANASCRRAAKIRSFSDSAAHGLTPGLCGASRVSLGTIPNCFCRREPFIAHCVPTGIEPSAILIEIALRRLMRRMRRAESAGRERTDARAPTTSVANETHRAIDHVLGQVITLGHRARRIDEVIVGGQLRIELIGLALQKAVDTDRSRAAAASCAAVPPRCIPPSAPDATCRPRRSRDRDRAESRPASLPIAGSRRACWESRCPCSRSRASRPRDDCGP